MKTPCLELIGNVTKVLPDATFRVKVDKIDKEILCYLSGRLTKKFVKPEVGDTVKLEISPTDLTKGRITSRKL